MSVGADKLPLRDIHLPEPVSWWPPAPGWWLLSLLIIAGLIGAWWLLRRYRRLALSREAARALQAIETEYRQSRDALGMVQSLSALLRRVCLSRYPRAEVAGLIGDVWLEYLDRPLAGKDFRQGAGRALIEAPYNPNFTADGEALLSLCRRWIAVVTRGARA